MNYDCQQILADIKHLQRRGTWPGLKEPEWALEIARRLGGISSTSLVVQAQALQECLEACLGAKVPPYVPGTLKVSKLTGDLTTDDE